MDNNLNTVVSDYINTICFEPSSIFQIKSLQEKKEAVNWQLLFVWEMMFLCCLKDWKNTTISVSPSILKMQQKHILEICQNNMFSNFLRGVPKHGNSLTTFLSSSIAFFHEHIAVFQLKHLISKSPGLEIFKMWSTIFYLQNWQIYCKISTKTSLLNHLCFTTSRWHHFDNTFYTVFYG